MPIYLHPSNLIVEKQIVASKYKGGLKQFRIDFEIDDENYHQEDEFLFSLAAFNQEDHDLDLLIENGLEFDKEKQSSSDFVIQPRYGKALWEVDFIKDNSVFAWHPDSRPESIRRMETISKMSFEEIDEVRKKGTELLNVIW